MAAKQTLWASELFFWAVLPVVSKGLPSLTVEQMEPNGPEKPCVMVELLMISGSLLFQLCLKNSKPAKNVVAYGPTYFICF